MLDPKITVIIPVYNVANFIERCARSLFEQTIVDIEYLFVNDGTPDNSIDIIQKVLLDYPHRKEQVKIVNHEINKGLSAARSTGIRMAQGQYIAHCDSDDWVEHDMYERMYNDAVKNSAEIVCCGLFFEYEEKQTISLFEDHSNNLDSLLFIKKMSYGGIYSSSCNKIFKRDLYIKHDIFPIEGIVMWEDMAVVIRLIFLSKKTAILNAPLYHYALSNSSSIVNTFSEKRVYDQITVAKFIEDFFINIDSTTYRRIRLSIQYLKFRSKLDFFIRPQIRNIKLWKQLFPDTNKDIWHFSELRLSKKILFWFAINGFDKIIVHVFDLGKRIKAKK